MALLTARGYLLLFVACIGLLVIETSPVNQNHEHAHKATINHKVSRHSRRRIARTAFLHNQNSFQIPPNALLDLHRQLSAHERSTRSLQSFGKRWTDVENTIHPATVSALTKTDPLPSMRIQGGENKAISPSETSASSDLDRNLVSTRLVKPQQRTTSIPPGHITSSSEETDFPIPSSSSIAHIKADEKLEAINSDSHAEGVTSSPAAPQRNNSDNLLVVFLGLIKQIEPQRNITLSKLRGLLEKAPQESINNFLTHWYRNGRHVKRGAPQRKTLSLYDILNSFPPTSAPPTIHEHHRQRNNHHPQAHNSSPLGLVDGSRMVLPPESKQWEAERQQMHTIYHNSGLTLRMLPDGRVEFVEDPDAYCVVIPLTLSLDWKVKIRGEKSGRYLAMRKDGSLYGTNNDRDQNTDFQHFYKPRSHDAFKSLRYGSFISIRDGRTTRRRFRNDTNKRTHFLIRNTSGGRLLVEGPITEPITSIRSKDRPKLPPPSSSTAITESTPSNGKTSNEVATSNESSVAPSTLTETTTTKIQRKTSKGKGSKKCRRGKRRKRCRKKKKKCRKRKKHRCQSKKKKGRKKRKKAGKPERRVSRSVEDQLSPTEDINNASHSKLIKRLAQLSNFRRRLKRHSAILRHMRRRFKNSAETQAAVKT